MSEGPVRRDGRAVQTEVDVKYRALMDHCLACSQCRAATGEDCAEAEVLRSAWSTARKEARR